MPVPLPGTTVLLFAVVVVVVVTAAVMVLAGPALAFGLVFVFVEPTTDKINVVEENEIPKIMESYCQLHENGTGGAALC